MPASTKAAVAATPALPTLPATVLLPKMPCYRHTATTPLPKPSWPLPPCCHRHRHRHRRHHTDAAATALPPHCHRCCGAAAVIAMLPMPLLPCHPAACCSCAAAVLQLLPRPPPRCRHHPRAANAAATLPTVAAPLLWPLHCRCVIVTPSIAGTVCRMLSKVA